MDDCVYVIWKVPSNEKEEKREFYCICKTMQEASKICNRLNIRYDDAKFFYEEKGYWTLEGMSTSFER